MRNDRLEKEKLRSDIRELRRRLRMIQKPELNILRRVEQPTKEMETIQSQIDALVNQHLAPPPEEKLKEAFDNKKKAPKLSKDELETVLKRKRMLEL